MNTSFIYMYAHIYITYVLIQAFSSSSHIPGILLGAGDKTMNKKGQIPVHTALVELAFH